MYGLFSENNKHYIIVVILGAVVRVVTAVFVMKSIPSTRLDYSLF